MMWFAIATNRRQYRRAGSRSWLALRFLEKLSCNRPAGPIVQAAHRRQMIVQQIDGLG